MNTCAARLPLGAKPALVPGPEGWPVPEVRRCGQSVGLVTVWDRDNHPWRYCPIAGHMSDVLAQIPMAEARHVFHEIPEPRTAAEWSAVRPEMAGRLR